MTAYVRSFTTYASVMQKGQRKMKRSDLIKAIIDDYTSNVAPHAINTSTYIDVSGSTEIVTKDYTKSNRSPIDIIEELAKEDPWDDALSGYGYDYYVDDSQKFHYFKRGSTPAGGANTNGLIITLTGAQNAYTKKMQRDYVLSEQPKEIITRVTCRGTASDGTQQSYTDINAALENTYGITKEKIDYVFGKNLSAADLLAYCTSRAKALSSYTAGTIYRGTIKIAKYPSFNRGTNTIVRAGDLVRLKIAPKSIDEDFIVLSIKYEEPNGFSTLEVVSSIYGRSFSPIDVLSQLKSMKVGDDSIIPYAKIGDLVAQSITANHILAGDITVTMNLKSGNGDNGTLKSDNYIADTSGWQITYAGNAEFNDVKIRGTLYVSDIASGNTLTVTSGAYIDFISGGIRILYGAGNLSGQIYGEGAAGSEALRIHAVKYMEFSNSTSANTSLYWDTSSSTASVFSPETAAKVDLGSTTLPFRNIYGNSIYVHNTGAISITGSFDKYDDIELINSLKTINEDGKEYLDLSPLPEEIYKDNSVNLVNFTSLAFGAIKQLSQKIENLEKRINDKLL